MFYQTFIRLCSERGESPSSVLLRVGRSKSAVTAWKRGIKPSQTALQQLADYFSVSVSFLLTGQDDAIQTPDKGVEEEPIQAQEEISGEYQERSALLERIRDSRSARILLHTISDMNNDQILEIAEFAMRLKEGGSNGAD